MRTPSRQRRHKRFPFKTSHHTDFISRGNQTFFIDLVTNGSTQSLSGILKMRLQVRHLSSAARFVKRPPWTPPAELKYPLREIDPSIITPSNWAPPMGGYDHLPFRVFRTTKGKQIPVYTDYKNGRTRCLTLVRRFRGDENALGEEMSRVCDNKPVTIRPGRVEVTGNYRGRVCEWLQRLGF